MLAGAISNEIWMIWSDAPDAEGRKTMQAILGARRARALDDALSLSNAITERLPDYAEGWNQKATVLFELGEFAKSLDAVETVLALEPRHFAALAGKGVILLRQGRIAEGREALRAALEIHPFLPERRLLIPRGDPI